MNSQQQSFLNQPEGVLLVNKPRGLNSFQLVKMLRKRLGVKKIGHSGILDPFATGVMVMLVGRNYTRLSSQFLGEDKEYLAEVQLGVTTDTYDCDGQITNTSSKIPTLEEVQEQLRFFQGNLEQIPPMFSAKKINGQKLYDLARQGKEVERKPAQIIVSTVLIAYEYPVLTLRIACSKGTYVRSIAHDLGQKLGCGAHLNALERVRSGQFHIDACMHGKDILEPGFDVISRLLAI